MLYRVNLADSFVERYILKSSPFEQQQSRTQQQQYYSDNEEQRSSPPVHVTVQESSVTHEPKLGLELEIPAQRSHEEESAVVTSINQALQQKYEEELVALKKQNLELRFQNGQILNHLQDGRQVHIENEIQALMEAIPQRSVSMVYKCKDQNEALKECYNAHLLSANAKNVTENSVIQLDILKCRPAVNQFIECANESKREFLKNQDL